MTFPDGGELHWRETYFVLFESRRRPALAEVESALRKLSNRYVLTDPIADPQGQFESLTLSSPDDRVALEITYESGDAVITQAAELADQLRDEADQEQLAIILRADARLDIMHFEHLSEDSLSGPGDEELEDEMLDPSCLLGVVGKLVDLTSGVPVDPASGTILP